MIQPIKTDTWEGLAVLVPDDSNLFFVNIPGDGISYSLNGIPHFISIPEGNWQLIGPISELTEEQALLIVPETGLLYHFKDYTNDKNCFESALSSAQSLLAAHQVYTVNPYSHPSDIEPFSRNHYDNLKTNWELAQARTGNWILLKKINEQ